MRFTGGALVLSDSISSYKPDSAMNETSNAELLIVVLFGILFLCLRVVQYTPNTAPSTNVSSEHPKMPPIVTTKNTSSDI